MILRRAILVVPWVLVVAVPLPGAAAIPVAHIDQPIHPVTASFLSRILDHADEQGAPLVVIQLDTPGGLSDSMKEMIQDIIHARTPVCVYLWVTVVSQ